MSFCALARGQGASPPLLPPSTYRTRASLPFRSLPATQCPSRTLKSCTAGPFLTPLTPSVHPSLPFDVLNAASIPACPGWYSLPWVHHYASVAPTLSPLLLLSTCRPSPLLVPRNFVFKSPVLLSSCMCDISSPAPVFPCLLVSFDA